jgi:hypothetical protein
MALKVISDNTAADGTRIVTVRTPRKDFPRGPIDIDTRRTFKHLCSPAVTRLLPARRDDTLTFHTTPITTDERNGLLTVLDELL